MPTARQGNRHGAYSVIDKQNLKPNPNRNEINKIR